MLRCHRGKPGVNGYRDEGHRQTNNSPGYCELHGMLRKPCACRSSHRFGQQEWHVSIIKADTGNLIWKSMS